MKYKNVLRKFKKHNETKLDNYIKFDENPKINPNQTTLLIQIN